MSRWSFSALGTTWQVDHAVPLETQTRAAVTQELDQFEQIWSRFRRDSAVTALATTGGTRTLPHGGLILDFYSQLHRASGGAINPLVGRTLADLGYDAEYSLRPQPNPAPTPAWNTLSWSGDQVTTKAGQLIDIGAAGKGLAIDLVAARLREAGAAAVTVDASGDIWNAAPPLRVGLEHPLDPTRAIGIVELGTNMALCGSASNRRAWGNGLHHLIDARTGRPTTEVLATWALVAGRDFEHPGMIADGLATAHFFVAPEVLVELWPHRFVCLYADGRITSSADLPGEIF